MDSTLNNLKATPNYNSEGEVTYTTPSLREFADSFNRHQIGAKKAKQKQNYDEDMRIMANLNEAKLSSKDHAVANDSDKAIKKTQVAYGIKEFYNTNYEKELNDAGIDFTNMTNEQVIDWYTELNPNSYETLKSYVQTPKDINNPLELYSEMGRLPTQMEEDLFLNLDGTRRFIENTSKNMASGINETYQGFRNFVNGVQSIRDDEAEYEGAFENYAYDVLGKDVSSLSDLEVYGIVEALKNKEIYDKFKPTPQKALTKSAAGVTDTMFTIALPGAKFVISALAADPLTDGAMNALGQGQVVIGKTVSLRNPELMLYAQTLTDEDREEFYAWVGSLVTMGLLGSYGGKAKPVSKDVYNKFIDKLGASNIINKFEERLKPTNLKPVKPGELPNGSIVEYKDNLLRDGINNTNYYNDLPPETRKELDLHSNKVINSDTISENRDVSRALAQLDQKSLKTVKTYEDLFKLNKKEVDSLVDMENTIAGTIEKRFGPEEDVWEGDDITVAGKYKGETEPNRPIKEFFDTMGRLLENEPPNLRKALDGYYQKYLAGEIDVQDLLNFKRALSQQYLKYKYKKTSEPTDNVASGKKPIGDSDINRIYDGLNYLIRDAIEGPSEFRDMGLGNIMQTLDQRLSPHLNLRSRLIVLANALNKEIGKIPEDILGRKIKNSARGLSSLSLYGILRWVVDKLTKSKEKMTNPSDFAENLPKSIKQINNILKEFPDEQRGLIMNSLAEYLDRKLSGPKESYGGNLGEGEVIEDPRISGDDFIDWESEFNRNPFLEDIVEVVPKESNMLGEDAKYNGNPVNYTTPTRVTPEGYAAEYGETLESWKGKQPGGYGAPAEGQLSPYEKTWEAYSNAMKEAGFSTQQMNRVKETLEKNEYKVKQQPSLFQDFPDKAEAAEIIKSNKGQEGPKLDLKSVMDELKELEESTKSSVKKSKTSNKSKKVSQEDIDHLFGKDKPELKKGKKSDK